MPATESAARRPLSEEIRGRLELASDLPGRLEQPNLPAARESAAVFLDCFHSLSAHAHLGSGIGRPIDLESLYRSFDAFLAFRAGEAALTASSLLDVWAATTLGELRALEEVHPEVVAFASSIQRDLESVVEETGKRLTEVVASALGSTDYTEWLVLFHQAVESVVVAELGAGRARAGLRSLMTRLELGQDDVGRMFAVSGETIRRWERGLTAIPAERRSAILAAESGLSRLQDLFRPERLPTVLRRPAELFDGESAMAWILRGLIADVADRYEKALLYQARPRSGSSTTTFRSIGSCGRTGAILSTRRSASGPLTVVGTQGISPPSTAAAALGSHEP